MNWTCVGNALNEDSNSLLLTSKSFYLLACVRWTQKLQTRNQNMSAALLMKMMNSIIQKQPGVFCSDSKNDGLPGSLSCNDCISRGSVYHSMTAS